MDMRTNLAYLTKPRVSKLELTRLPLFLALYIREHLSCVITEPDT